MNIALIYKQLTQRDKQVLLSIEKHMAKYKHVPLEVVERTTRIPETGLTLILSKLHRFGLVERRIIGGEKTYTLTYRGLDILAIDFLVSRNIIAAMGDRLGVGKESIIYRGLAPGDIPVAVKFLRLGMTSFHHTRRVREWAGNPGYDWFKQAKLAAEREYRALRELYEKKALVPAPIGYNRHVVVTRLIIGVELYRKPPLKNPLHTYSQVLRTMRIAYVEAGIIHGDLSEYNILVDGDGNPYIIDWPQYVYRDHPDAERLLRRDIEYITRFFNKNYGLRASVEDALRKVRGEDGA